MLWGFRELNSSVSPFSNPCRKRSYLTDFKWPSFNGHTIIIGMIPSQVILIAYNAYVFSSNGEVIFLKGLRFCYTSFPLIMVR